MAIPIEIAQRVLGQLSDPRSDHLFAQSDARCVLQEVGEKTDDFPHFDPDLEGKVTAAAYSILAAGLSIAERTGGNDGFTAIEKAANLLSNVHLHNGDGGISSRFHTLVASMAFYSAGQYSKAFVSLKNVKNSTDLAHMISSFIRKRPNQLIFDISPYLVADLSSWNDESSLCEQAITTAVARAFSFHLEFLTNGNEAYLVEAENNLDLGLELASDFESPALWWVLRLLRQMFGDTHKASLWTVLPPFFHSNLHLLDRFIRHHLFSQKPVIELWKSQRDAIPIALDSQNRGAVVNMRTSAGKTRIAELAILKVFSTNPHAKVLYLAPFKSLALEIEQDLGEVFEPFGFSVSHLYGGFRVSSSDRVLTNESSIIIATPEKARAIFRCAPELFENIELVVIDEGHLLGPDPRLVKNEIFLDHLRIMAESTGCRILLLSAVLPNPEDLANWISGDPQNLCQSEWKPSGERFGILRWNGNFVRLDWRGEFPSFNSQFVVRKPLGWGKRRNHFPNNKKEAVAATAVRLSAIGPTMIFSARAISIPGLAEAVLLALGENPEEFDWPERTWRAFQAACNEELVEDDILLKTAKFGVICHSNKLPTQVRLATERLMRSKPPRVLIASKTLGQGVNIGISSVIVASPYIDKNPINHQDFWNICGRAGRAFVDNEGKVLFAIDEALKPTSGITDPTARMKIILENQEKSTKILKNNNLADDYFNSAQSDPIESGIFKSLALIRKIAKEAQIGFDDLVEMIVENDFSAMGSQQEKCFELFDLIDDGLLALHEDGLANPNPDDPVSWVDTALRGSLAAIQAQASNSVLPLDEMLIVLKARIRGIIRATPERSSRKAYVSTGLPLSSAKQLFHFRVEIADKVLEVFSANQSTESILVFLEWLENWGRENSNRVLGDIPSSEKMNVIRPLWICGVPMRNILCTVDKADAICKDLYEFRLPWLLHATAQLMLQMEVEELSETLADIALMVELGVPNRTAAFVFLSGINSRSSATEISRWGTTLGNTIPEVRNSLDDPNIRQWIISQVSESTRWHLETYGQSISICEPSLEPITSFTIPGLNYFGPLLARSVDDQTFLCSVDGRIKTPVDDSPNLPFSKYANNLRYSFEWKGNAFHLSVRSGSGRGIN